MQRRGEKISPCTPLDCICVGAAKPQLNKTHSQILLPNTIMSCSPKLNSSTNTKTNTHLCRNPTENDDGSTTLHLNAVKQSQRPSNAYRSPRRQTSRKLFVAQAVTSQEQKK